MYIDGQWRTNSSRARIEVDNPATEAIIGTIPEGTEQDANDAIEAAKRAHLAWSAMPAIERADWVFRLAKELETHTESFAQLVTQEQGKPLSQARGEIGAAVRFLRYAADNARRIEGDLIASDNPFEEIQIRRHSHGVVVALTAWNYPAALAARKIGPALVTGNTVVLLSHENTPFSGLALAKLAGSIGLPDGILNVVTGRGAIVGQAMVSHPQTGLVTMTGSTRAGREIYRTAAESIKVIRLELGGKAPFIVMEDANIDVAVDAAIAARYTNCGQICTCNERMYLHDKIAGEFTEKFVAAARALNVGDPTSDVDMGPKISRLERDKVADIVEKSVQAGAEVLLDGGPLTTGQYEKGYWYAPTVLAVRDNQVSAARDEVFGPVAVVRSVSSFEEAVALANDTSYGLSAYLFTDNFKRLQSAPQLLQFGELYLNRGIGEAVQGFHTGWGMSGLGGEDGKYGFDGYLRKQTSYLNWAN
ncbi:UNVERIFIED_CONTAM: hypothetical protein GTU68_051016 [Idotea baltica]|nr:hypothetical protein [Idotea baltica]